MSGQKDMTNKRTSSYDASPRTGRPLSQHIPIIIGMLALNLSILPPAVAQDPSSLKGSTTTSTSSAVDRLLAQVISNEQELLATLQAHTPLVETYIQEIVEEPESGLADEASGGADTKSKRAAEGLDHYFLGRLSIGETIEYESLVAHSTPLQKKSGSLLSFFSRSEATPEFLPRGFAQMAIIDLHGFNRTNYEFTYVRREFLGEVRTLVFDITPREPEPGRFVGRIWVEDQDFAIVRFNGTYLQPKPSDDKTQDRYFHFDSWRVQVDSGDWIPSQIYVEERHEDVGDNTGTLPSFKAQTRIWDYAVSSVNPLDELTRILIESETGVTTAEVTHDVSPLESQRAWERQAEENVLARLQQSGFLAPPGPVDKVLNTVVDNLIIAADLNIDAECRVLLTTPMETFSIGHTIVISRGLIDVLPDEASLALVLADELAHIVLGHPTPTQFAFYNQTMLPDAELLAKMRFQRTPQELDEAGIKTIEIMRSSPYQDTSNAGLFLKALQSRASRFPRLLAANLGNQVANEAALARLAAFTEEAPELQEDKLEQIAALPLGSRIKLNPWDDTIRMVETTPVALLSPREKMPFEVTPFVLYLTHTTSPPNDADPDASAGRREPERENPPGGSGQ